jgi:hypothetical protein
MEKKFDDNFLEDDKVIKKTIEIDSIDESIIQSTCNNQYKKFNICINSYSIIIEKELCVKLKDNLIDCLKHTGKFISK